MKKASLKIVLRDKAISTDKTRLGKKRVYLRYIAHGRCTHISLGIDIEFKYWIPSSLRVRTSCPNSVKINKEIHDLYRRGQNIIGDNYYQPLHIEDFSKQFKMGYFNGNDFYEYAEHEISLMQEALSDGTIKNYKKLLSGLREWKPRLLMGEISVGFLQKFHKIELQKGNLLSTIYKKHANLKTLLNLAVQKSLLTRNPYSDFKIKGNFKSQNTNVLTETELNILKNKYLENVYMGKKQEVLKCFLFSCYTGLSFIDFNKITYSDLIKIEIENKEYYILKKERVKTKITFKIPIVSSIVKLLLGKGIPSEHIFWLPTNQETNRYLKQIMKDVKIDRHITFHRARHTFRTIAAKRGIQDSIAERIMGHTEGNDIKDIYIHLHDEDIIKEMLKKWTA